MRRLLLVLVLLTAAPLVAQEAELRALVESSRLDEMRWPDFTDYRKHLQNFYEPNGYALAWVEEHQPTPQAMSVIALFKRADEKGVNAVDYDASNWDARIASLNATSSDEQLARFDLALSATLMRYISDLHIGRINPRNIQFDLDIEHKKYYLPDLLNNLREARDVNVLLAGIEPPYDGYRRMQGVLARYRALAAGGDQPQLTNTATLKPGQPYAQLDDLSRFLIRVGDLDAGQAPASGIYSGAIVTAMKRFQRRHGLDADGAIGKTTFAELNVPISKRVRQIQLALERWRWAPSEFARPPIIVNIPEFRLRALDEQLRVAIDMNVVVGKAYAHQTPVFGSDMKYIVLRPYWNVPPSIQRGEIGPKLENDRTYLRRNNYEIVGASILDPESVSDALLADIRSLRVSLRQKPGPDNALGLLKFMFPNRNNVYLHSTPSQQLFSRTRRDFSHGCIRVEHPAKLAEWVLRDQPEWTLQRIESTMQGDKSVQVNLRKPIPVLIIYSTVVPKEEGDIYFLGDIYGHDETLENALALGYPYPA